MSTSIDLYAMLVGTGQRGRHHNAIVCAGVDGEGGDGVDAEVEVVDGRPEPTTVG